MPHSAHRERDNESDCWQVPAGVPLVGNVHRACVKEDGLGCLAGNLLSTGVLQEVADHPPEDGALRIPLLKIKCPRPCTGGQQMIRELASIQILRTASGARQAVCPLLGSLRNWLTISGKLWPTSLLG